MIEPSPDLTRHGSGRQNHNLPSQWAKLIARLRAHGKRAAWACVLVAAAFGAYSYVNAPTAVPVVAVKAVDAAETLGAAGRVQGEKTADLGLDVAGVVTRVLVREGDRVGAGQLIMSLDKSELDSSVQSAYDAVRSAEAEYARASRPPLSSEIARARAEISQARQVGDARVAQAQARVSELRAGARPQELREAEVELQHRRRLLTKAQTDLKRTQNLVKQGALARASLEQAEADVDAAQTSVSVQQERLSMLKAGPRAGEMQEALAALSEARASRDTGVKAAQEGLNVLLANPRPEDVAAARAKADQARSELRRAENVRGKADLRAPFAGVVASVPVEQGQSVSPGQTLVVLHQMSRPVITVETDEENLKLLRVGQTAAVSSDAYPGQTFDAALIDLGSRIDSERGTIELKLRPAGPVSWLRPDMTVDVNIITRPSARRMVVPPSALTRVNGRSSVMVVRDGIAVPVPVTTGGSGPAGIAISGDLRDGELVARDASRITPDSRVKAVRG